MISNYTRREVVAGISVASCLLSNTACAAPKTDAKKHWTMTQGIPDRHVRPATRWLLDNFGPVLTAKLAGTQVSLALACAIACQESAYTWFDRPEFKTGRAPEEMMRLLVLDNVSPRRAFPRDTAAFKNDARFRDLAPGLIAIADASRMARGYSTTGNLLYGYGLFQYDLQNIQTDPTFWRDTVPGASSPGLWGDVSACISRFIAEMNRKIAHHPNDERAAVAAYNGSGPNARAYAEIVLKFRNLADREIRGAA